MHVAAIILAAGKGARFKSRTPKPLVRINSKPIISYSLRALSAIREIKSIVVVVNRSNRRAIQALIDKGNFPKVKRMVLGGAKRQESVLNGILAAGDSAKLVLIHDSARPFASAAIARRLIREASRSKAAICGVPVKSTIKEVDAGIVKRTPVRSRLWEIQTPQVFDRKLLLKAYARFGRASVTDDSMLIEKLGARVKVIKGSYDNIKITTPGDLRIAQVIVKCLTG